MDEGTEEAEGTDGTEGVEENEEIEDEDSMNQSDILLIIYFMVEHIYSLLSPMETPEHIERPQWKELRRALDALVEHLPQERQEVMKEFRREVEGFCRNIDSEAFCSLQEAREDARKLFDDFFVPITQDAFGPDLDRFDDLTDAMMMHARWFFTEQARMKEELEHIRQCMTTREHMADRIRELIACHGKRRYEGLR